MATKPKAVVQNPNGKQILQAVYNMASANYRAIVPKITNNNLKEVGEAILNYEPNKNEFINAVNRIARVIVESKLYENPWRFFKKGVMELGDTIEDLYVNLATPYDYNPELAESEVFKRVIPDVKVAFFQMNFQKFYKQTIQNQSLRLAFLSFEGIENLLARIVDAMYTASNYDEFVTMKYMLAKHLIAGRMYPVTVATPTLATAAEVVSQTIAVSNDLTFLSNDYNPYGVYNATLKENQYLIVNSRYYANMNVGVLAAAFNMDKAEFMGHIVLVDNFGKLDNKRLSDLFADSEGFQPIPQETLTALNNIPCVLVDENFFMIFDNLIEFTEQYNGQGLYWNYFLHNWKTFAISPFANGIAFVTGTPKITSVTIAPATATVSAGTTIKLTATVATEYFAPQTVDYAVTGDATIDIYGNLTIDPEATGTITVVATSTYDATKSATATITIAGEDAQ